MYEVKEHLLHLDGNPVNFVESPHGYNTVRPLYLIIHYTAGTTANSAISWFQNPTAQASAHLVIDRGGEVTQMRNFNRAAWHAGKSKWNDIDGLNRHSLGIELVNAGKLKKSDAGVWLNWANREIPPEEVVVMPHKDESSAAGWHIYTLEQIEAVVDIGAALHAKYRFLDVLGHDDISPGRKVDPGPAFPMISAQSRIIGRTTGS